MTITRTIYENILKEYEDMQLSSAHELDERRVRIEKAVPELKGIEEQITSLYVKRTMQRLGNASDLTDEQLRIEIDRLNNEKVIRLAGAGFSAEDLLPHYSCSRCRDTGYTEDGSMCSCFKDKLIDRLYASSHIRDILDKENFNTFSYKYYSDDIQIEGQDKTPRDIAKEAVTKALAFIRNFASSDQNLFICGGIGVGKTFLTNCIAREIIEAGFSVIYLSSARLFEILADAAFDRQSDSDISRQLIYDCDLLIIDDLGTEMVNSFVQTRLFDVINERLLKRKHNIISSNLSVRQLQEIYSERVFSRVVSSYTVIKLFADDIRIQKALEG